MNARIQKWGNSQGLRVPKPILAIADFAVGEAVELSAQAGQILIRPVRASRGKVRIEDLVARMPKGLKTGEEPSGPPRGREAW